MSVPCRDGRVAFPTRIVLHRSLANFVVHDKYLMPESQKTRLRGRNGPESRILGEALRLIRRRADMTQEDVSARAGTNAAALSHIESGERDARWSTIARLLPALGSDVHELGDVIAEIERQGG
jgi:DNA-binding XRE family transcriptional regulator